jgi:hypothetical protein
MAPVEGFWVVQYEGVRGAGGGVLTLLNGRLYGGDSGFTYIGSYKVADGLFVASAHVRNFLPGVPNDLGIEGDFDLSITGNVGDHEIYATAVPVGKDIVGLAVKLTKFASF